MCHRGSQSKWRKESDKACFLWVRKVQVERAGAPSQLGLGSFLDRNGKVCANGELVIERLLGPAGPAQREREH